jgi:LDH2 family malate/lactate/ureidoglycolate dehydrogenase
VPESAALVQAEVLVEGELRGHPSHGLLRLPTIVRRIERGLIDPRATGELSWRADGFLAVDGQDGLGPVVGQRALQAICERAARTGVAVAAMRRTSHLGMLAWYVEGVARRGQCAIATCTSEALVHPWGGRTAMLGTNPLAIGVPTGGAPLVLDMSTGAVSMGKVIDHARRGAPLRPGWAVDASGAATTDAVAAMSGAISPFGGAKGYALGVALEVLVASLSRTATGTAVHGTLDVEHESTKGDLFVVIDGPGLDGQSLVADYLDELRHSPPADADHGVQAPGDGANARRTAALRAGIQVAESTWQELISIESQVRRAPS